MSRRISVVQYWGGCPQVPNSKWRRFLALIERCAQQGWRTHLVWSQWPDDPDLARPFTDVGCQIMVEPRARGSFDFQCVRRVHRVLRRTKCDIFHCHNVHTSPLIGATLAGVPVRIWSKLAMSPYYEQGIEPRGLHRLAPSVRVSCSLAHRVLALSGAVRNELLEQGVSASKIAVVRVPIETELYAGGSTGQVRESLGLSASDVLIVSVGHAVP